MKPARNGTSNDAQTAQRLFENPASLSLSKITRTKESLIRRFHVPL
jgi:hypothetical protein